MFGHRKSNPKTWSARGAGILFLASDTGRVLLGLRARFVRSRFTWGIFGGKLDGDESAAEGAAREAQEELRLAIDPKNLVEIYVFEDDTYNFQYTNFLCVVPAEFKPKLNSEHDDAQWFSLESLPEKLHPGVAELFSRPGMMDKLVQARSLASGSDAAGLFSQGLTASDPVVRKRVRTYWGKAAAGILFMSSDTGKILLGYRSRNLPESHTWGIFGGKLRDGDSPAKAAAREASQEIGLPIDEKTLTPVYVFSDPDAGFEYTTHLVVVPDDFEPLLNWRHEKALWFDLESLPQKLHPGVVSLLSEPGMLEKLVEARDIATR